MFCTFIPLFVLRTFFEDVFLPLSRFSIAAVNEYPPLDDEVEVMRWFCCYLYIFVAFKKVAGLVMASSAAAAVILIIYI